MMQVGEKFSSYEELKDYITKYGRSAYTQIYCYDSKKLTCPSLLKKCRNKITVAKKSLLYYFLEYRCVHGGKYQFKGNNKRKSSTLRNKCPFRIKLSLSEDGQFLEIQVADLIHSHAVTEELYKALPQQRALAENEKHDVAHLLKLKCNKKWIKNFIKTKTGKTVTLKDLSNINTRVNKSLNNPTSTAKTEVQQLVTSHGHILSSKEKYKKTLKVGEEIASLISQYGTNDFKNVYEQLKIFRRHVQNRNNILVVETATLDLNKVLSDTSDVSPTDCDLQVLDEMLVNNPTSVDNDNIAESTEILLAESITFDEIETDTLNGEPINYVLGP